MNKHAIANHVLPEHAYVEADLRRFPDIPGHPPRLVLVRGLPGSGKSALARDLGAALTCEHFEADQYFMRSGRYQYDAGRVRDAHA